MNTIILEKLKKLLQMHKGATGAESDLALEKAQALATQHNIDLALAVVGEPVKEEFVEGEYIEGKRQGVAQRFISNILAEHFNVKIIYSGSRFAGRKILFLGRKSDVDFAIYAQSFLKNHMMSSWQYYQKSNSAPVTHRATFFESFSRGLNLRLTEAKRKQEDESFSGLAPEIQSESRYKYALVVQTEKEERENFVKRKYEKLRYTKSVRLPLYGGNASQAGFSSGYTTNIARPLTGQLCLN
jgi:hypothetical protein